MAPFLASTPHSDAASAAAASRAARVGRGMAGPVVARRAGSQDRTRASAGLASARRTMDLLGSYGSDSDSDSGSDAEVASTGAEGEAAASEAASAPEEAEKAKAAEKKKPALPALPSLDELLSSDAPSSLFGSGVTSGGGEKAFKVPEKHRKAGAAVAPVGGVVGAKRKGHMVPPQMRRPNVVTEDAEWVAAPRAAAAWRGRLTLARGAGRGTARPP